MSNISNWIIPLLVLLIVLYGVIKKKNVYNDFIDGSKESFDMILNLFPSLLAMILGVNIIIKSGVIESVLSILTPVLNYLKLPMEILPLALMRPISGSSALVLLNNILSTVGPDSLAGRLGAIIQGSTDTTFYVLTLYFGSVGIKKIKYALWAGLLGDLLGIISSIIIVKIFF